MIYQWPQSTVSQSEKGGLQRIDHAIPSPLVVFDDRKKESLRGSVTIASSKNNSMLPVETPTRGEQASNKQCSHVIVRPTPA